MLFYPGAYLFKPLDQAESALVLAVSEPADIPEKDNAKPFDPGFVLQI